MKPVVLVVAAGAGAWFLAGCGGHERTASPAPAATPTASAPVTEASPTDEAPDTERALTANGEFVSPIHSELASRVPGRVARVLVDVGARVKKGQPLLELEKEYFALDLKRAEAELARAAAAAQDAARELERKRALREKESIAAAMLERVESAAQQAQAARAAAVSAVATARQRLEDTVLASPIDGVVAEKRTDIGESLGTNTVTFVLLQIAPLKLQFRLPEDDLAAARRGGLVRARVSPYRDDVFEGRISAVVPTIDPATRSFLVEAEFPNRDGRLRPGLFARVELSRPQ